MDSALNNLQWLIFLKTKQNQTKSPINVQDMTLNNLMLGLQ